MCLKCLIENHCQYPEANDIVFDIRKYRKLKIKSDPDAFSKSVYLVRGVKYTKHHEKIKVRTLRNKEKHLDVDNYSYHDILTDLIIIRKASCNIFISKYPFNEQPTLVDKLKSYVQ